MLKAIVGHLVRIGAAVFAGWLFNRGYITGDDKPEIVGALTTIITTSWGICVHYQTQNTISNQSDHIELLNQAIPQTQGFGIPDELKGVV